MLVTCEICDESHQMDPDEDSMRFYKTDSGIMCELCMEDIEDE